MPYGDAFEGKREKVIGYIHQSDRIRIHIESVVTYSNVNHAVSPLSSSRMSPWREPVIEEKKGVVVISP